MTATATITASASLTARVKVLAELPGRQYQVEVLHGTGGWDAPGKILTVSRAIISDVRVEDDAPEAPAADETAQESAPGPASSLIDSITDRAVEMVEAANAGRDLTPSQFVAAVMRTVEALTAETFRRVDQANPAVGERVRRAFFREMETSGQLNG